MNSEYNAAEYLLPEMKTRCMMKQNVLQMKACLYRIGINSHQSRSLKSASVVEMMRNEIGKFQSGTSLLLPACEAASPVLLFASPSIRKTSTVSKNHPEVFIVYSSLCRRPKMSCLGQIDAFWPARVSVPGFSPSCPPAVSGRIAIVD